MKKLLLGLGSLALVGLTLVGCGGNSTPTTGGGATTTTGGGAQQGEQITIWVGNESAEFYEKEGNAFFKSTTDYANFTVKAVATDIGSNAGEMITDNTKCGDIVSVAHDNIGKLAQANKIKPIVNEALVQQIRDDNPSTFVDVVQSTLKNSTTKQFFAAPYISQALVMYYNKSKVTDEQAKTFEGMREAAANAGDKVKSYTILGFDGYNFSFTLLSRNAETNESTLKLYKDGTKKDVYAQGDDEVAFAKWAQRSFADDHGALAPSDTAWAVSVKNGTVLGLIGGAWNYKAFLDAVGEDNFGVAPLPTYTLTAADVEGTTMTAGTKVQAGTFADCKCFVINGASSGTKYNAISALIKHLSSKEVQNKSFKECSNVPAYKNADQYIESIKDEIAASVYQLAKSQIKMNEYGMPQPFITGQLNSLYYSAGAPDLYKVCVLNVDNEYGTTRKVREVLYSMEYTWQKNAAPSTIPDTLPATI